MKSVRILGIESSCDETGVAIYDEQQGLLSHVLHTQIPLHQQYGGVVPELASRDHIKYLVSLVDEALNQAHVTKTDLDGIAYTAGPGLIGALLTGACFAKSFAFALGKPAIAVHHLEAHLLAALMDDSSLNFPFLVLLVSGGHTQLIQAKALGNYVLLGETLDDAVGEAFDKTAKLMGLPYPGGAQLAKLAEECPPQARHQFPPFPRPMLNRPGLNFSFSGLKTHVLTTWNTSDQNELIKMSIAYAFQHAVVETLSTKCQRAIEQTQITRLVLAGGVGANQSLRIKLTDMVANYAGKIYFPRPEFCTDNGAMIAFAGLLQYQAGKMDTSHAIEVKARWSL